MPEEGQNFQRRLPSVGKKISDIKQDDIRVSVTGIMIDKQDGRVAVIDDGTGKVNATFDDAEALKGIKLNQLVRVLGRVMPMDNGFELRGDAVQDMSGLDMELKKRADSLA